MTTSPILISVLITLSTGNVNIVSALTCIHGYTDVSNTQCICDVGFKGVHCESIQDYHCFNGGTYDSHIHGCHCWKGFYGTHCEHSSSYMYCHNGGHFQQSTMTCQCPSYWGGLQCHDIRCQHGRRDPNCPDHCICDHGYEGQHCTNMKYDNCLNGGTYDYHNHKCCCLPQFTGWHCEKDLHCINGGIYNKTTNACKCLKGWTGVHCEIITCQHGHHGDDLGRCICNQGYEGKHCDRMKHDFCAHNGTYDYHNHRCNCLHRFSGPHCQKDLHCLNGGTYHKWNRKCRCPSGWTGPHCEIISCDHGNPDAKQEICLCNYGYEGSHCAGFEKSHCFNGGSYSEIEMICKCPAGYSGQHCENEPDSCYSQPCHHGGTCYHSADSFYCSCPTKFTGRQCEILIKPPVKQINICDSHPCKNGGSCYDDRINFVCACRTGFTGRLCESALPPLSNQITTNCSCPITKSSSKVADSYPNVQTSIASTPQALMPLTFAPFDLA